MTRGIYKITLGEHDRCYIGKSLNIEQRICQHKSLLKTNRHYNWKMQQAFNTTKVFDFSIIEECTEHTTMFAEESKQITLADAINIGYNIAAAGISGSGLEHPSSVYSKEQILDVVALCLDPKNVYKDISETTGVSTSTIRHIADRNVHYWLEELFPEECAKLIHIRDNRLRGSSLRSSKNYKYTSLISPEGVIYKVTNISAFGREHGLDGNKVGEIMRGTRNMHKNWKGYSDGN